MADRLGLTGRTVVVSGAGGGGIGTAVCRACAESGAAVVGLDISESALDLARQAVKEVGADFVGLIADVRHKEAVDQAFDEADKAFGGIDGLVNVVGGQQRHHWQPLLDFPLKDLDEILDLNLRSIILTSQAAARAMVASGRGGSIVSVASVAALTATPYSAGYGIAKAGLVSLIRTMAVEWGRYGIRANAIAPGTIRTPNDRAGDSDDIADQVLALKRRGSADELANAVLFALSELSSFVTGQVLVVDGGSLIRASYLDADDIPVFMRDPEIRARLTPPGGV
jgi:NAD(P)-dependent dehydrogenase (short-subunit alcohol dehydrogenase family)